MLNVAQQRKRSDINLALHRFSSILPPKISLKLWKARMTAQLASVIQKETYLGHDILVETFGPVTANPNNTGSLQTHHTIKISIWLDGEELKDARETPSLLFVSREDAIVLGFEIGRMIVSQRRESAATGLAARIHEFFKSSRLAFASLRA